MLDNLMDLVRKYTGSAVNENPAIPNDKNEAASEAAGSSILNTLKNALGAGKIGDVLGYFKNGGSGSPGLVDEAKGNYARELQEKFGINPSDADDVAGKVVPQTMNELAEKTADPNDNRFNIQDIFNKLSGGKTSGLNIQEKLNSFTGGKFDKDGDGDLDLQDLKAMFSGEGSVVDKVKGMFK